MLAILVVLPLFIIFVVLVTSRRVHVRPYIDTDLLAMQAHDLHRYASEVTVAAERAAAMAHKRREEWLAAQAQVDVAWQQYEPVQDATQRLNQATAYPTRKMRASRRDRERYLHRAAMTRCSHRQLSALELSDVLAHRNGWDPKRHPVEQEIILQRAARDSLYAAYRAAVERERKAWQAADIAAAASASLRHEARSAAHRAKEVQFGRVCAARLTSTRRIGQLLLPVGHN